MLSLVSLSLIKENSIILRDQYCLDLGSQSYTHKYQG